MIDPVSEEVLWGLEFKGSGLRYFLPPLSSLYVVKGDLVLCQRGGPPVTPLDPAGRHLPGFGVNVDDACRQLIVLIARMPIDFATGVLQGHVS